MRLHRCIDFTVVGYPDMLLTLSASICYLTMAKTAISYQPTSLK